MPFSGASYDSAALALMRRAYDTVFADMKAANVTLSEDATTAIARRILDAVAEGKDDLNLLILKGVEAANAFR